MLLGCDSTYIAISPITLSLSWDSILLALRYTTGPIYSHKRIAVALAHYRLYIKPAGAYCKGMSLKRPVLS